MTVDEIVAYTKGYNEEEDQKGLGVIMLSKPKEPKSGKKLNLSGSKLNPRQY